MSDVDEAVSLLTDAAKTADARAIANRSQQTSRAGIGEQLADTDDSSDGESISLFGKQTTQLPRERELPPWRRPQLVEASDSSPEKPKLKRKADDSADESSIRAQRSAAACSSSSATEMDRPEHTDAGPATGKLSLNMCPDSIQIPISWGQVLYYVDPKTQVRKYDFKTSPLPLPHKDLEFRGYVFNKDKTDVSAWFVKRGLKAKHGTRHPSKPSGGVNKAYFDGLKTCKNERDRLDFVAQNRGTYKPHSKRYGIYDPELWRAPTSGVEMILQIGR